jgi:hypothetical protein
LEPEIEGGGLNPYGKWLNELREIAETPGDLTDKTDKTGPAKVLSVLSARSDGASTICSPDSAVSSVSFVGSPSYPFQDFRSSNNRYGWHEEDAPPAFERAAFFESDQGMAREDAEALLWRQLKGERKRWMQ